MTSGAKSEGRFGTQEFRYMAKEEVYICPAGGSPAISRTRNTGWSCTATGPTPAKAASSNTAAPPANAGGPDCRRGRQPDNAEAKRYRYYVSASLLTGDRPQTQKGMRVPAGDIEGLVLDRLRTLFSSRTEIGDALVPLDLEAHALDAALCNASELSERWLATPPFEMGSLVCRAGDHSRRSDRNPLEPGEGAAALEAGVQSEPDLDPIVLSIQAKLRRASKGKRLVIENGATNEVNERLVIENGATNEVNERLVELIKEAFAIRNQLLSGSDASIEAMSGRIGMNKGRLTSLIRLSYLARGLW
jgi:site-specific DNA recombinase